MAKSTSSARSASVSDALTHNLSREDLILLETLLEHRSMSVSARELGLSVAGASRRLSNIRQIFHNDLFIRVGLNMEPTPLMEELGPEIRELLTSFERLFNRQTFNPKECERRFVIASIDLPVVNYGPQILNRIKELAPKSGVDFVAAPRDFFGSLASGEMDIAISPRKDIPPQYHSLKVGIHGFVLLCSPESDIYREYLSTGKPVDFKTIRDARICTIRNPYKMQPDFGENERIYVPNLLTMVPFILQADCIAPIGLVPYQRFYSKCGIAAVPMINYQAEDLTIQIIWHHRYHTDVASQWFRSIVSTIIKETIRGSADDPHVRFEGRL